MTSPVYFVTDAHLGSGSDSAERENAMIRWLSSIEDDARGVVMLGDIFDFWFTYRNAVPRGYVRLLGKMAEMADRGIEFHFFLGNHDMWLFDYLEKEIGVVMHSGIDEMTIDGKLFLLGHGDGMGSKDNAYNVLKYLFRNRLCQKLFACLPPDFTFPIAKRWSSSSRKSHGSFDQVWLGDDKEHIYQYCLAKQKELVEKESKTIDFFLFGHRHVPIVKPVGEGIYVNVGNWLDNRDYALFDGENVLLKEYK